MLPDKHKAALLILEKMGAGQKKDGESSSSEEGGDSYDSSKFEGLASELLDAVASKDEKALAEWLKSFHEMCCSSEGDCGEKE